MSRDMDLVIRKPGCPVDDLVCAICHSLMDNPQQLNPCGHAFCLGCIEMCKKTIGYLKCPIDRQSIYQYGKAPLIYYNLLNSLEFRCVNHANGCTYTATEEGMKKHMDFCRFDVNVPRDCEGGCGLKLLPCDKENHSCVKELRKLLGESEEKQRKLWTDMVMLQVQVAQMSNTIKNAQDNSLSMCKEIAQRVLAIEKNQDLFGNVLGLKKE